MDASVITAGHQPNFLAAMDAGTVAAQRQYDFGRQQQHDQLSQQYGPGIMAGEPDAMNALAQFHYGAGLDAQNTRQGLEIDRERIKIMRAEAGRQAQEWARTVSQDEIEAETARVRQQLMPMAPAVYKAIQGDTADLEALARQYGVDPEDVIGSFFVMQGGVEALATIGDLQPEPVAPKVGAIPEGSYMVDPNDPAKGLAQLPGYAAPPAKAKEPPSGYTWNNPNDPASGVTRIPGMPAPTGTEMVVDPATGAVTYRQGPGVGVDGPTAGQAINAEVTSTDSMVALIDDITNDPSLDGVIGPIEGQGGNDVEKLGMARSAYYGKGGLAVIQKIAQLQGNAWLGARAMLKGGGQITDYESRKAEAAVARLARVTGEAEFRAALKDLRDAIVDGKRKLEAVQGGAAAPSGGNPGAIPSVPDGVDPELWPLMWEQMDDRQKALFQ